MILLKSLPDKGKEDKVALNVGSVFEDKGERYEEEGCKVEVELGHLQQTYSAAAQCCQAIIIFFCEKHYLLPLALSSHKGSTA